MSLLSRSLSIDSALLVSIGNTIAFVRLVRAASKKQTSDETPFLSRIPIDRDGMRQAVVDTLESHKNEDSDYTRWFVSVFKGLFRESDVPPPKNGFFCLVPALCLSSMDASIQSKEMMHKKNITRDCFYTDDGFAIGLTFCLVVMEQIKQYER